MNHRMVLGRYADVRETAALTLPDLDSVSRIVDAQTPVNAIEERKRKINAVVERVRRHSGARRGLLWDNIKVFCLGIYLFARLVAVCQICA